MGNLPKTNCVPQVHLATAADHLEMASAHPATERMARRAKLAEVLAMPNAALGNAGVVLPAALKAALRLVAPTQLASSSM